MSYTQPLLVNGLPLPPRLVELIQSKRWKRPKDLQRLDDLTGIRAITQLEFMSPDRMDRETLALAQLYEAGHGKIYRLICSTEGEPLNADSAWMDVRLVVSIAVNADEEGICLDYRPGLNKPRVVAGMFPDETSPMRWKVIAPDFASFAEQLGL